jgi:hypothetical protein
MKYFYEHYRLLESLEQYINFDKSHKTLHKYIGVGVITLLLLYRDEREED